MLHQALIELMAEKSFGAITVGDIAERATVNRATFYAHFTDKHALLEYTIREMIQQRLHSRLPAGSSFNSENLAVLILAVCEFLAEMNRQCPPPHGQMGPLMEKQIKAELYEILQAWVPDLRAGSTDHSPTTEQVAVVASWAIYGAAVQWSQQERPEPAERFVQQVLPLILSGLQPVAQAARPQAWPTAD